MKTLILIRHGKTQSIQNNSERRLTVAGIRHIHSQALLLKKFINGRLAIIHSPTVRANQTAKIIAEIIQPDSLNEADLRIKNADNISEIVYHNQSKGICPVQTYLELTNYKQFSVESPLELFKRFETIVKKYDEETILLVSHEASLEGFLKVQNKYKLVHKTFTNYLKYGDFAILKPTLPNVTI